MFLRLWSLACLLIALLSATVLSAADATFGRVAVYDASDGKTLQQILDDLGERVPGLGYPDAAVLAAGGTAAIARLALVDASPAGVRQALCHAAGWWWAPAAGTDRIRLTTSGQMALDALSSRVLPSTLVGADWCEAPVRQLLAPWMGPTTGLLFDPDDGSWSACLDAAGHAHLLEAVSLFERPQARAPALVPDADMPEPARMLPALPMTSWADLLRICAVNGVSISVAPGLDQQPLPSGAIPPGPCGTLSERFRALGWQAVWSHGVLCVAPAWSERSAMIAEDRQLPALRRRIAWLTVAHAAAAPADGLALVAGLSRHVAPWWWSRPGAGMWYLEGPRAILVAADAPTIHAVLDALALVDRYGLDDALARLASPR
jgi:hypothetical protein